MTATAKKIAAAAQDTVNGHIEQAEQWLDQTPGALSHAAGKVEHLTRVGVEKAPLVEQGWLHGAGDAVVQSPVAVAHLAGDVAVDDAMRDGGAVGRVQGQHVAIALQAHQVAVASGGARAPL